jgi:hypothetical protein
MDMARYGTIDRDTPLLWPPALRAGGPADHRVHGGIDAVERMNRRTAPVTGRGTGSAHAPPGRLLALLVDRAATGLFSRWQIERASDENVTRRLRCADSHPDHATLCTFHRKNAPLRTQASKQNRERSARCGVRQVGQITVASDGPKILAHANKRPAVSHGHAQKTRRILEPEIAGLRAKADQADATPRQDGRAISGAVQRRQDRPAPRQCAEAEMGARASVRLPAKPPITKPNSPAAPPAPPCADRLRHRTATAAGRALDQLRQQTVAPVSGPVHDVSGFRRSSLCGPAKVTLEGEWVGLTAPCKPRHRLGAAFPPV